VAGKRNIDRFPPEFMFQLTQAEYDLLQETIKNIAAIITKIFLAIFFSLLIITNLSRFALGSLLVRVGSW